MVAPSKLLDAVAALGTFLFEDLRDLQGEAATQSYVLRIDSGPKAGSDVRVVGKPFAFFGCATRMFLPEQHHYFFATSNITTDMSLEPSSDTRLISLPETQSYPHLEEAEYVDPGHRAALHTLMCMIFRHQEFPQSTLCGALKCCGDGDDDMLIYEGPVGTCHDVDDSGACMDLDGAENADQNVQHGEAQAGDLGVELGRVAAFRLRWRGQAVRLFFLTEKQPMFARPHSPLSWFLRPLRLLDAELCVRNLMTAGDNMRHGIPESDARLSAIMQLISLLDISPQDLLLVPRRGKPLLAAAVKAGLLGVVKLCMARFPSDEGLKQEWTKWTSWSYHAAASYARVPILRWMHQTQALLKCKDLLRFKIAPTVAQDPEWVRDFLTFLQEDLGLTATHLMRAPFQPAIRVLYTLPECPPLLQGVPVDKQAAVNMMAVEFPARQPEHTQFTFMQWQPCTPEWIRAAVPLPTIDACRRAVQFPGVSCEERINPRMLSAAGCFIWP